MERDPLTATGTSGYAAFPEKTGSQPCVMHYLSTILRSVCKSHISTVFFSSSIVSHILISTGLFYNFYHFTLRSGVLTDSGKEQCLIDQLIRIA